MAGPNLNAKISADAKQFNKTMKGIKSKTKGLSSSFRKLAAGISAYFSFRALTGLVEKLDGIGKGAKKLQITTDEFQQLSFAAERGGTDIATFDQAFKKMNKTINDAKRGLSTAIYAFDELGLSVEDFDGKTQTQKLQLVARSLSLMKDETRKAALSTELLARGGMALIPVIDDLDERMAEAKNRGLVSQEQIAAAEELSDKITNLKTSMLALVGNTGIVSFLDDISSKLIQVTQETQKFISEIAKLSNEQELLKLGGATGAGLDRTIWDDIKDTLLFQGKGDTSFTIAAPSGGQLDRKKEEIAKKTVDLAEKEHEAKKQIITDQEIINKQNIAGAQVEKEKVAIKKQALLQESIVEANLKSKSSLGDSGTSAEQSDRLRRIGVTVGASPEQAMTRDKERNILLKQVNKNLGDIKRINSEQSDVARAG
jgi:hypothetical protein